MRLRLLELLRCPACGGRLDLEIEHREGEHVLEGLLRCRGESEGGEDCAAWYPVMRGVPRMLLGELRAPFAEWARERDLDEPAAQALDDARSRRLKRSTAASFGHEWTAYDRFGWSADDLEGEIEEMDVADHDAVYQEEKLAHTLPTFRRKTLLAEADLEGRLTLDVGCGNGRYAFVARRFGAEAVGLDLSAAVDAAFANTRHVDGIHIVQADVFRPPFAGASFDVIYSIGVLHHTPSARRATEGLVSFLTPGGLLSVHVYRRRNPVYEIVDRALRAVTVRLPLAWCWRLCWIPTLLGKATWPVRPLFAGLNAVVSAYASHHHNFDWYSAPIATHHDEEEVAGWLRERGLGEIVDDSPLENGDSYYARIYPGWARRKDGTVKRWVHVLCPHWALTVRGRPKRRGDSASTASKGAGSPGSGAPAASARGVSPAARRLTASVRSREAL